MRYLDHPNIVRLHGVAAQSEPLMIVMELVRRTRRVRCMRRGLPGFGRRARLVPQEERGVQRRQARDVPTGEL